MAVTINQIQKADPKKSFLDRTVDALNIANSASGIYKNLGGKGEDAKIDTTVTPEYQKEFNSTLDTINRTTLDPNESGMARRLLRMKETNSRGIA